MYWMYIEGEGLRIAWWQQSLLLPSGCVANDMCGSSRQLLDGFDCNCRVRRWVARTLLDNSGSKKSYTPH